MYLCCKQSVGLLFLCKRAFSRKFLFRWICNWGFLKFWVCFGSFLFILLLMLSLSLVCTKCFGCDVVSGCALVWICDWSVKNLVDVLKLSWHLGDCSLIFFWWKSYIVDFWTKLLLPSGNLFSGNLLPLLLVKLFRWWQSRDNLSWCYLVLF